MMDRWMDGWKYTVNNIVLAHPYHAGKPCSKFGYIPPVF